MGPSMINSYPKVYNVGHRELIGFFDEPVTVEEKVDGSQFSFMLNEHGELEARSSGQQIVLDAPGMFAAAIETIHRISPFLRPGYVYRSEYLSKPKHNTLCYGRVPVGHIVLFDIACGPENYLDRLAIRDAAGEAGLEIVPLLYAGKISSADEVRHLLDTESFLGGQKVEGLVFKRRHDPIYGPGAKPVIAKFVSEAFKERNMLVNKKPTKAEIVDELSHQFATIGRWRKAVQHLREAGKLQQSPTDIGSLILEVQRDLDEECGAEIRDALYKHFFPRIKRTAIRGLPEWYKGELLDQQFVAEPPA
jgi:hypothetical protein